MIFRHHKHQNFTMVYGFKGDERRYSLVLTLCKKGSTTWVYGLLARGHQTPTDFFNLWKYLKQIIYTTTLSIEVLPEHARVYKHFLPIISKRRARTFDGHESEIMIISMQKDIRHDIL